MEFLPIQRTSDREKAISSFKAHFTNIVGYSIDLFYDCREILSTQFERFEFVIENAERENLRRTINDMSGYSVSPRRGYRFYIVNGLDCLVCAVRRLSECTVNDIIDFLDLCVSKPPEFISSVPKLVSTAFIFEGNEIIYHHDIYIDQCVDLVRHFDGRNIVLKKWI